MKATSPQISMFAAHLRSYRLSHPVYTTTLHAVASSSIGAELSCSWSPVTAPQSVNFAAPVSNVTDVTFGDTGSFHAARHHQTPSRPGARPRSERFQRGGRESEFLAVAAGESITNSQPMILIYDAGRT